MQTKNIQMEFLKNNVRNLQLQLYIYDNFEYLTVCD